MASGYAQINTLEIATRAPPLLSNFIRSLDKAR
jgi:hypothetical protein